MAGRARGHAPPGQRGAPAAARVAHDGDIPLAGSPAADADDDDRGRARRAGRPDDPARPRGVRVRLAGTARCDDTATRRHRHAMAGQLQYPRRMARGERMRVQLEDDTVRVRIDADELAELLDDIALLGSTAFGTAFTMR